MTLSQIRFIRRRAEKLLDEFHEVLAKLSAWNSQHPGEPTEPVLSSDRDKAANLARIIASCDELLANRDTGPHRRL